MVNIEEWHKMIAFRMARTMSRSHPAQNLVALDDVDRTAELLADSLEPQHKRLSILKGLLLELERHCPCGARPEDVTFHPHAPGCNVELALIEIRAVLEGKP